MDEHEQHVRNWYASLCGKLRRAQLDASKTLCVHCGRAEQDHIQGGDLRCTFYATTTHFRPVNHDEIEKATATVVAIEALAVACGWDLNF